MMLWKTKYEWSVATKAPSLLPKLVPKLLQIKNDELQISDIKKLAFNLLK